MEKRCNLINARQERKLTQSQLASIVGMSRPAINSIESGEYIPSAKNLDALESFFSINRVILMEMSEPLEKEICMKNKYEIRGDVTVIFLSNSDGDIIETMIDTSDLPRAMQMPNTWVPRYDKTVGSYYVESRVMNENGTRIKVRLHRWIYEGLEKEFQIDHIYHDTLDNRRSCNLRKLRNGENTQNRKGAQRNNTCGVRGVSLTEWGKYRTRIQINGKPKNLGTYETIHEAENAVMEARKLYMPYSSEALAN